MTSRIAFVLFLLLAGIPSAVADDSRRAGVDIQVETTLAEGVECFNAQVIRVSELVPSIGDIARDQPPLTVDEVIASLRAWDTDARPIDPQLLTVFKTIAESRMLPAGSEIDFTTGWKPGNKHEFTVWWIDLSISAPNPDLAGSRIGYSYRIRDRKLSSRPVRRRNDSEPVTLSGDEKQRYIAKHFAAFVDAQTAP